MRLEDLDYQLPQKLIAQRPLPRRDASRLLVVDRASATFRDAAFIDLPDLLSPGDLLVLNDTRVVPARVVARRATGGRIDGLFVHDRGEQTWDVLLRGRGRLKVGERLMLEPAECGYALELLEQADRGRWIARVSSTEDAQAILDRVGRTPLPPYIRRDSTNEYGVPDVSEIEDRERYQTIFARRCGAVAAPTASLHFTDSVFQRLDDRGVERATVTLHVGPGTFAPITADALEDHPMHVEWFDLPAETVERVAACRARGGFVVGAGTTTVRVLESSMRSGALFAGSGWTDLFIKPPYTFRNVDRMITNFHLPRSTLLALVMAMGGVDLIRAAYEHAVGRGYRFYSYGDAMLLL